MISPSQLGAGYALVPVAPPPDWSAGPGTGIYHRGNSNTVYAQAGNTVYRTPHNVVREAEAGANWPGDLTKMMFLPDGRIVKGTSAARDMFRGADMPFPSSITIRKALAPSMTMAIGGGAGYALAPNHRIAGVLIGAFAGGVLGLLFG